MQIHETTYGHVSPHCLMIDCSTDCAAVIPFCQYWKTYGMKMMAISESEKIELQKAETPFESSTYHKRNVFEKTEKKWQKL